MRASRPLVRPILHGALLCGLALALAACEGAGGEGSGGVTEGEARALDEAASMLDEKRLPDGALPDVDPPVDPSNDPPAQ